ncbi:MAG TPA: R3H domain-containing nucleic acid-binding protein [Blastocatellia bacterium]|nr:R3H domain-containing nucleic acid-binding protein [Blastocatellia bacterium]
MGQRRIEITDDLDLLLEVLPARIREELKRQTDASELIEVVLDLGRPPEARFPSRAVYLTDGPVTREDLQFVVSRVGAFTKDNRAGIERTLHRISAIRNRRGEVVGLTCRVGRAVFGTVEIVKDVIESGKSILLLGKPGVGKTTLLREAARVLADELGKRVIVVDTSNEIAGDGDVPHPGIGRARRMQVPSPELQHAVMIEAVENHMPEVIVVDEIGTEAEALAARTIAERGVQLIATAHGNTLDNLLINPTLCDLIGGIQAVTLSDEEAKRRGTQKTVLERKAPPTFDVLIEIQDKDRFAIHHDVATVVDRMLRGIAPRPEIRVRGESGHIQVLPPPPTESEKAPTPSTFPSARQRAPLKIFPFAVSRDKLRRAIEELGVPAQVTTNVTEADIIVTLKSHAKSEGRRLREAARWNIPIAVLKSNTTTQMKNFLIEEFRLGAPTEVERADQSLISTEQSALNEAEEAIEAVLSHRRPVELSPQNAYIRRLQHELVQRYGLISESKGQEPFRRVVIYPRF